MTVIGEKTADYATFIDDLAGALTAFSNWTDADSYVQNDGTAKDTNDDGSTPSDTDWHNNARVLEDTNTGTYLLMYIHSTGNNVTYNNWSGVRICLSTDWDGAEHHPAGDTNVEGQDAGFESDVGFHRNDTYPDHSVNNNNGIGLGIWGSSNTISRDTLRTTSVSYVISANSDGFNVGLWNDNDGNNGIASMFFYDYLGSRFYDDPGVPLAAGTRTSRGEHGYVYGFESFRGQNNSRRDQVGDPNSAIEAADWGIINPSSEDDTFFFRYPAVYKSSSQSVPVAYLTEATPNDEQEGGAHGDDYTHDGTTYKVFKKSGASRSNPVSAGLRHE